MHDGSGGHGVVIIFLFFLLSAFTPCRALYDQASRFLWEILYSISSMRKKKKKLGCSNSSIS